MDDDFNVREEYFDQFDISKICSLLEEAWSTIPDATFYDMLKEAVPADLESLQGEEMEELLEEFIHQNK